MILIYTTHTSKKDAVRITSLLFKEKLIACVNYWPIESSYLWHGRLKTEKEFVALYKAQNLQWKRIKTTIAKHHPYENPCIIKINVEANESYEKWVSTAL